MTATDAFFQACGGREPLRLELWPQGGGVSVTAEFRKPYVVVGRGRGADMGVDHGDTALRHLYLQLLGGRLYAVRLSEEHPAVRGEESWRSGWVSPDDLFGVHGADLRVLNPVQGADGSLSDDPEANSNSGEPLFSLECGQAPSPTRTVTNSRPLLLIGRAAPSKLRVRHPSLCRTHAAVVSTPHDFWLVDLSHEGGVRVNGEPATVARLRHGDVFHCGDVPFRFGLPGHPEGADRATLIVAAPAAIATLRPAEPATPDALQVRAVLDQVAQVQQHSYEQFRQVLGTVMQMVGVVMADQRAFVKDELDRMERLTIALARPPQSPPPAAPQVALPEFVAAPPVAPPALAAARPAPPELPSAANDLRLHDWVESQLQTLQRDQDTLWSKLKRRVSGDTTT